jgi:hypothetical protein
MHRDYEDGNPVDFNAYGEIVLSGWGKDPSPEIRQVVNFIYNQAA